MKNINLAVIFTFCFAATFAQTLYIPGGAGGIGNNTSNSNVGIGTGTTLPDFKLHISGGDVLLKNGIGSSLHLRTDGNGNGFINNMNDFVNNNSAGNGYLTITGQSMLRFNVGSAGTSGMEIMRITDAGNVGISEANPVEKFQIGDRWTFHNGGDKIIGYNWKYSDGEKRILNDEVAALRFTNLGSIKFDVAPSGNADSGVNFTTAMTIANDGDIIWGTGSQLRTDQGGSLELGSSGTPYIDFRNDISSDYDARFILQSDNELELRSANLLIGKSSQINTSYKLDVAGKIRSSEIVVNTDGADHVFQEGYPLTDLEQLGKYISKNKHLPGIPSAAQMQKEGMAVGEVSTKLLEKIEELTLYVIQLRKENKEQQKLISTLIDRIDQLENK